MRRRKTPEYAPDLIITMIHRKTDNPELTAYLMFKNIKIPLFLCLLFTAIACTGSGKAKPVIAPADLPLIIRNFEYNLHYSGKAKITGAGRTRSGSFEAELNHTGLTLRLLNPIGGIVYQITANSDKIMTVYFDENRADVYPNTADNRRLIMGTELGFDDMLTVFSGRLTEANQAHWEFNAEEKVLSHALYTVKNISPSNPNSQTAEQPESPSLPSVRFENYAAASGIRFPGKITLKDPQTAFEALFVRTDIRLYPYSVIQMPSLPPNFYYVEHAPTLNNP